MSIVCEDVENFRAVLANNRFMNWTRAEILNKGVPIARKADPNSSAFLYTVSPTKTINMYHKILDNDVELELSLALSLIGYPFPRIVAWGNSAGNKFDVFSDGFALSTSGGDAPNIRMIETVFNTFEVQPEILIGTLLDLIIGIAKFQDELQGMLPFQFALNFWREEGGKPAQVWYKGVNYTSYSSSIKACFTNVYHSQYRNDRINGGIANDQYSIFSRIVYPKDVFMILSQFWLYATKFRLQKVAKYIIAITYQLFDVNILSPDATSSINFVKPATWFGTFLGEAPTVDNIELPNAWETSHYFHAFMEFISSERQSQWPYQMVKQIVDTYTHGVGILKANPRTQTTYATPSYFLHNYRQIVNNVETGSEWGIHEPSPNFDISMLKEVLKAQQTTTHDQLYAMITELKDIHPKFLNKDPAYAKFLNTYNVERRLAYSTDPPQNHFVRNMAAARKELREKGTLNPSLISDPFPYIYLYIIKPLTNTYSAQLWAEKDKFISALQEPALLEIKAEIVILLEKFLTTQGYQVTFVKSADTEKYIKTLKAINLLTPTVISIIDANYK